MTRDGIPILNIKRKYYIYYAYYVYGITFLHIQLLQTPWLLLDIIYSQQLKHAECVRMFRDVNIFIPKLSF